MVSLLRTRFFPKPFQIDVFSIQSSRRETALDGPIMKQRHPSPTPQLASPVYFHEKSKLSSQSMHSPGRNGAINLSTIAGTSIQKQQLPSPNRGPHTNLNKSLSNSATVSPTTDIVTETDYYLYQQQLSPPYYHAHPTSKTPVPVLPTIAAANTVRDTPLRRAVSNVSSNHPELSNEMPPKSPMTSDASQYQNTPTTMPTTTNIASDIHVESPKNVTVVQPSKFQPYKEVTKPFEMSDLYKYSTKFRQKNAPAATTLPLSSTVTYAATAIDQNSPKLPPKNISMMQHRAAANNTPQIPTPYTIRYHQVGFVGPKHSKASRRSIYPVPFEHAFTINKLMATHLLYL